ncbi:shikimate dehydrogenase [Halothiobacillus sp. DCM-1]|uniref:shikimate dehydrogenase n=1 Tax=Halothiobacillus sp. DCM-1 TaxID=3112558 RepID=UPI0032441EF5
MGAPLYGVIGNPIGHSRSPAIHRAFAEQTDIALQYDALLAPLDGFEATVAGFRAAGGRGLNVTVPFKAQAYALCGVRTPRAERAGAVNTLIFPANPGGLVEGDNTDGAGLLADLHRLGVPLNGRRILLLGAGGATRGVLEPLLAAHPAELFIANRSPDKAQALAQDFLALAQPGQLRAGGFADIPPAPFDLIINATAASLAGEQLPLPRAILTPATLAYDMAYGATPTVFLRWAESFGAQTADGLGMLVEQAAESFWRWHSIRPETEPVLRSLRETLQSR